MAVINGIYSLKMSGAISEGFALLYLKDGILSGVDASKVTIDGHFETSEDGAIFGSISVGVPPNTKLIQCGLVSHDGFNYSMNVNIPADFATKQYLRFETPLGPINGILELLRPL
jgi:hypothetical protein